MNKKIFYHLPGLFEFYDLYKVFFELWKEHREYFYPWCEIASVYGAPSDCLWGGGRVGFGEDNLEDVLDLVQKHRISARLTFSNSLLEKKHLTDEKCNYLCSIFESLSNSGIIIHSDLLLDYLQRNYPDFYFVSSTTKVLTDFHDFKNEIARSDFRYVVPDFRLNKALDKLAKLSSNEKEKVEFLCNECCWIGCKDRKVCYENVSRKSLCVDTPDHICKAPGGSEGYRFSKAIESPAFISVYDILHTYLPMGFVNFKIEGRGLGSAMILEFLLYYLTKPEYHIYVRESIYLDSMLDLL